MSAKDMKYEGKMGDDGDNYKVHALLVSAACDSCCLQEGCLDAE